MKMLRCLVALGAGLLLTGSSIPGSSLAGEVAVGAPLNWRVLDNAEINAGYAAAMIVADWDKDGADEVLVPRWGGPAYQEQALHDRRSDLLELDGSIRETGVLGEQLGSSSIPWDYTGDGIPEIANDSRERGGLAYDQWLAEKEADLARQLERQLAPLRQRQQAIKDELEQLRGRSGGGQRIAELKAEDDEIFRKIDELRFSGSFSLTPEERRQGSGFFVRGDTSIVNLAGKEIAQLAGRHRPGSQHVTGCFTKPSLSQFLLGPAYFSFEIEPVLQGGRHQVFAPGGQAVAKWDALASFNYLAAGDLDGDGISEIAGRRLGFAPYAYPLAEIAVFDPNATPAVRVLMRCATTAPGVAPAACFDLTGDRCAEIILGNGLVLSPATGTSWQLDRPPFTDPAYLRNTTAPAMVLCDLDGRGQPELWTAVQRTQLAGYAGDGSLVHLEDMGGRIRQIANAQDAAGQEYLVVQLGDRILVWRVEPLVHPGATLA